MEKEKAGEGKGHIIIIYRGNLSGRGKRRLDAKGRERRCRREGNLPRKGGKGAFRRRERDVSGKRKGCFGEGKGAFRGRERGVSGRKIAEGIGIGREIN
ncbi:hypothetical protein [Bacteroides fragilis]|uniref:hypothetical protein n=2 Tax=Bacteroides fragilis TaxID=817 RepID=UPI0032635457